MDADNRNTFLAYPTDRVVGTIGEDGDARAAIEALLEAAFTHDDIDVLHGEGGLARLDPTGADHGFLARFHRTLIRAAGPAEEYRHLKRHVEDVREGRFVVMVLAKQQAQRELAAQILSAHGAEFIGFYGRWAYQAFAGGRTTADAAPAGSPAAVVKRMFAAFGARDLDALVETVHPASRWNYYGANPEPGRGEFSGREKVRSFFERIFERLDMTESNTDEFVVDGDTVVIFGSEAGTVRATGQPFRNMWSQKYVVKDGLIIEMAEYNIQVEPRR